MCAAKFQTRLCVFDCYLRELFSLAIFFLSLLFSFLAFLTRVVRTCVVVGACFFFVFSWVHCWLILLFSYFLRLDSLRPVLERSQNSHTERKSERVFWYMLLFFLLLSSLSITYYYSAFYLFLLFVSLVVNFVGFFSGVCVFLCVHLFHQ